METPLSRFHRLLAGFSGLHPDKVAEPTIFSIGGKNYYENPTTDILAFFCDDNGPHQLGDVVLRALINCLPEEYHALDSSLVETPEREVRTRKGMRIDLLLESAQWAMVLENKVYHQQNNPFDDYQCFVQEQQNRARFGGKTLIFVVLSPTGEAPPQGWHGISYPELITALKKALADRFISQPVNKWLLLLREFILHLESLMPSSPVNQDTLDFVLSNLAVIKEIQDTKLRAIDAFQSRLHVSLQNRLGQSVKTRLHHWGGYPALRFALADWKETYSDVVLFLSGEKSESSIHVYAHLRDGYTVDMADSHILTDLRAERWLEGGGKYRGYRVRTATMTDEDILHFLSERLLELNEFERSPAVGAL